MSLSVLAALFLFVFTTTVTPGPNNMMLLASGVNFGFRRTLPHMAGISLGVVVMVVLCGLGLAQAILLVPGLKLVLKVLAVAYFLWLAWKLAGAGAPGAAGARAQPMTLLGAAAFQWVNPKAWAMILGALAAYAAEGRAVDLAIVTAMFGAVSFPSISIWAWAGERLRDWLMDDGRRRIFNLTMAGLLLASLWPVLWL